MKLKTAHVTNFRSVEDSGVIALDRSTCLVGKNEAGKTAILQAIAGLNPHPATPVSYDKERDYPRRHLTDYEERHEDDEAAVVTTTWELDAKELEAIANEFGPKALSSNDVTVLRRYVAKTPEWDINVNVRAALDHIISHERLDAPEKAPLAKATDTKELIAALEAIEACAHRGMVARRSDRWWPPVPRHGGQPFRPMVTGSVDSEE